MNDNSGYIEEPQIFPVKQKRKYNRRRSNAEIQKAMKQEILDEESSFAWDEPSFTI